MAFVFEELCEADKARYEWSIFKGWIGHLPYPPLWWSIDRERDIFFIWVQGAPHETEEFPIYALYWKGEVIRIEAQSGGIGKLEEGVDTTWTIRKIYLPTSLISMRSEIIQALKEAIAIQPVMPQTAVIQKSLTIQFEGSY